MARQSWKDLLEAVGIIAIIGSLIFVGVQLSQDRQIAEAQLSTDAEIKQLELSNLISQNRGVWLRGLRGDELSPEEEVSFETLVHSITAKYDSMWIRADRSLVDRNMDELRRGFGIHIYSHPGLRRVWSKRCDYYRTLTGEEIAPCARVKAALSAYDDGLAPPPTSIIFSL